MGPLIDGLISSAETYEFLAVATKISLSVRSSAAANSTKHDEEKDVEEVEGWKEVWRLKETMLEDPTSLSQELGV